MTALSRTCSGTQDRERDEAEDERRKEEEAKGDPVWGGELGHVEAGGCSLCVRV